MLFWAYFSFEMIFPPYGLFCGSFREVWGEGNISPNGHFGFKVLVWPYSAAPSGRFGEKEIQAQTGTKQAL